eukprot:CAMPEP_0206528562 /NCGR_PEP_ID=MMETSP0325_2-20121206/2054_1 /ASSEMBLY_ACC=CAM_ASM_000347 /TAXON_ID=2866 /ORGANISM="Crypthecodinium cohnii, Strain Seligo" /LENGTH=102 /DNA_ID=CAMNT_0054024259 /DNA_START=275 /DNA_END=580 /DNA_ORIENTATION=+
MMLLLVQSGRIGKKKVSAFIQELLSSRNKKHLRLLLAAAMSSCFLAGLVLPRLRRARTKVLANKEADRVPLSEDDATVVKAAVYVQGALVEAVREASPWPFH